MEFRVLGPLEVVDDSGVAASPPGRKERAILARLLLEPGRPGSADALLEAAWPGQPAGAAARSLHVRLAHLRSYLEPGRAKAAPSSLLVRDDAGYRLVVGAEQVDVQRFERLVRGGAAGPFRMRATALGRYLLYGRQGDFLAAGGSPIDILGVGPQESVTSPPRASESADWRVDVVGLDAFRVVLPSKNKVLVAHLRLVGLR